ncbi:isochorismatase family protein [Duganella callida]|uniref:Isochorismatase family protein n=1 Tax=Duganella callida TaxID=2561932 RepID=A0A4Y9S848_9BURK|nr:isochorismatase family protein [Duganella callida]TFW16657.1 isochorismatase family protein [Duganella callida]
MGYQRLTADNAVALFVDHQTGLCNGVHDQGMLEFLNGVTALAELARSFELPTIVTTSAADGPNGPVLPALASLLPQAQVIHRPGEINAWDNQEFVAAVRRSGRKKLIVAGVSTDVCLAFAALGARADGYEVYAVIDASGTWNPLVREVALARMVQAGVTPITWVAVGAELMGDWRSPHAASHGEMMSRHLPFHGNLVASFDAARGAG